MVIIGIKEEHDLKPLGCRRTSYRDFVRKGVMTEPTTIVDLPWYTQEYL
jgi:hypothetical protein